MSLPSINFIVSTLYHACQPPPPHTHGTLLLDCLETRVAIMPADQTDEVCRSNVGRDFGSVQSIYIVITQLFTDCKRAIEY